MRPAPGTIGLSRIGGFLGKAINVGQALHGDPSGWSHVFVVVDDQRVIQAMPGGSEYASLDYYLEPGRAVFLPGWPNLTGISARTILDVAESLIGKPYGFLDYVSLIFYGWGIKLPLTRKRIQDKGQLICSQLADEFYRRLGIQLFDDGRLPMDVTPGDIHIRWTEALSLSSIEGRVIVTTPYVEPTPMVNVDPTVATTTP